MASAVDKQPAAARLAAVAAAGCLPTATNDRQNSYTTPGDTTQSGEEVFDRRRILWRGAHLVGEIDQALLRQSRVPQQQDRVQGLELRLDRVADVLRGTGIGQLQNLATLDGE